MLKGQEKILIEKQARNRINPFEKFLKDKINNKEILFEYEKIQFR